MAEVAERLGLGPDEFAFHFETAVGVDADALATFLKRAATVARRSGADLRVVGMSEGSLDVVIKAIQKGARKELLEKPIGTAINAPVTPASRLRHTEISRIASSRVGSESTSDLLM